MTEAGRDMKRTADTRKIKYVIYRSSTLFILIAVIVFFTIINKFRGYDYLTAQNVSTVLNQATFLALAGLAQLFVVLTGGINLAIGSIMVLTSIFAGQMLAESSGVFFLIPILVMLAVSSLIGLFTGLVVTKMRIPSFIATFAIMYGFRGVAWIVMGRDVIYRINPDIRFLSGGTLFRIGDFIFTMPMLITLCILLITGFILKNTSYGRRLYFTGSNAVSGKFSGVPVGGIITMAYVLSGLLCGVCAIMYTGRLNAIEPGMYGDVHFDAVSVVLIGGASMLGGVGNVWSTAVGAIIISFIQSGMNSIQVPSEFQTLVLGVLIIFSVLINVFLQTKKNQLENDVKIEKK